MAKRFVDDFKVILLDMANTFMFDEDRFSEMEDFGSTYRALGGQELRDERVKDIMLATHAYMNSVSRDPARYEEFPSVDDCLRLVLASDALPDRETTLLEQTFAHHEIGRIPPSSVEALHQLARTHRLGVVSNIWSSSEPYHQEFEKAGIRDLFEVVVFSSDHGCIKPSPRIFKEALAALNVSPRDVLFVGDSLKRDVAGAKAVGLSAALLAPARAQLDVLYPVPDLVVEDLRGLLLA